MDKIWKDKHIYVYMYMSKYTYIHICIYIYTICMCIYIQWNIIHSYKIKEILTYATT